MEKKEFRAEVISFLQKHYGKHKKIPSTATIFKSFNKTRFYEVFPQGLAEACEAAGTLVPEERLKQTQKAQQAAKEKRVAEAIKQGSPLEDLKQSYKREEEERRYRKQRSEELAEQVRKLATDPNEDISGPVLDALEKVLPRILKRCHGVTLSLWGLQKLNEITGGDLSYETVTEMVQYARLSDEDKQAMHSLLEKLDGMTLVEIAKYAKLSDEDKQAVHAVLVYSHIVGMSPMEAIAFLDLEKKFK